MHHAPKTAPLCEIMIAERERLSQAIAAAISASPRAPCQDTEYPAWRQWHAAVVKLADAIYVRTI